MSIGHALREQNRDADRLANEAMDQGMGRVTTDRVGRTLLSASADGGKELEGIVRNSVVELTNGNLPEGAQVRVRLKDRKE